MAKTGGSGRRSSTTLAAQDLTVERADRAGFEATCERVLRAMRSWLASTGRPDVDPWAVEVLLEYKWSYLGGDLGRWTGSDLFELLTSVLPRKALLEAETIEAVVPAAHALLDFLADEGHLVAGGDSLGRLHRVLDDLAPEFARAAVDPSRFGMAKAMVASMLAGGTAVDAGAIEGWLRASEPVPPAVPDDELSFPPIELASDHELAATAAEVGPLRRVLRFLEWAGQGRRLTPAGNLRLADGKELVGVLGTADAIDPVWRGATRSSTELVDVDVTFRVAEAAALVRTWRGRVLVTAKGRSVADDPLAAWEAMFDGRLQLGMLESGRGREGSPFWFSYLDDQVGGLLAALYSLGGDPYELEAITEVSWEGLLDTYVLDDIDRQRKETFADGVSRAVEYLVRELEDLGVIERLEVEERPLASSRFAGTEPWGGGIVLTDLGRWLVNGRLRDQGGDAPVVGDLSSVDAPTLLDRCAHYPPEVAEAEIEGWCAERTLDEAVEQLIAAAGGRAGPLRRSLAFLALDQIGREAEPSVRALLGDAELRPYAMVWLVSHGLEEAEALSETDTPVMAVESLYLVLSSVGPEAMSAGLDAIGSSHEQEAFLAQLWVADTPYTAEVLEAVADHHRNPSVAKAARRALFKHRSPEA